MASWRAVLDSSRFVDKRGPVCVLDIDLGTTNSTVAEARWDPDSQQPPIVRCGEAVAQGVVGDRACSLAPAVAGERQAPSLAPARAGERRVSSLAPAVAGERAG